jgi:hypothetical protein
MGNQVLSCEYLEELLPIYRDLDNRSGELYVTMHLIGHPFQGNIVGLRT